MMRTTVPHYKITEKFREVPKRPASAFERAVAILSLPASMDSWWQAGTPTHFVGARDRVIGRSRHRLNCPSKHLPSLPILRGH